MSFVGASNVLQVNLNGTYLNIPVQNNLYFHKTGLGSITLTDATNLSNEIVSWWDTNIKGYLSDNLQFDEMYMTDLTSQTAPTYDFNISLQGVKTSNPMPGSVALAVGFITAGRGRSSRGRNYLCGLTEIDVTNNAVAQTFADGIETGYAFLSGFAINAGFEWIVYSRYSNGQPRTSGLVQPVTSVKVADIRIDTQRRRLT